jgi:uncharacterized phage-like protein YoqJ
MAYISEFVATRPDTTVPFFYDSEQEEHKKIMETSREVLEQLKKFGSVLSYEQTYSEDTLICTRTINFLNRDMFFQYLSALNNKQPTIMIIRNQYFLDNKHSLLLVWRDTEDLEQRGSYVLVP